MPAIAWYTSIFCFKHPKVLLVRQPTYEIISVLVKVYLVWPLLALHQISIESAPTNPLNVITIPFTLTGSPSPPFLLHPNIYLKVVWHHLGVNLEHWMHYQRGSRKAAPTPYMCKLCEVRGGHLYRMLVLFFPTSVSFHVLFPHLLYIPPFLCTSSSPWRWSWLASQPIGQPISRPAGRSGGTEAIIIH